MEAIKLNGTHTHILVEDKGKITKTPFDWNFTIPLIY